MSDHSHKHVACENCGAKKNSLFADCNSEQTTDLNSNKSCSYYKKNQGLFLEGSIPRGIYCINKGKVKVFTLGDEGKEQIIQIAGEGEVLGFRSIFSGEPYKVSATTLEDANICFIHRENFLNMIDTNSALRNSLLKELSKELGEQAEFITNMAQKSVRERLAFVLLILKDVYKDDPINLSREDLANFVGTATETLIRLLKEFKEDGYIEIATRKLTILNNSGLIKLAGNHHR
jgi:CRP/FNR family transcriptional regulator